MISKPPLHPSTNKAKVADQLPISQWQSYFTEQLSVNISPEVALNVYLAGKWTAPKPLLILHHGAGQSALTFALLARQLESKFNIAAFDCRGHGDSTIADVSDMAIEVLTADCVHIVKEMHKVARERLAEEASIHVILCGHSMGGGVVVRAAAHLERDDDMKVAAVFLLDVCEQVALQSLHLSKQFVSHFPVVFPTLNDAVSWAVGNVVNNRESAAISIPSQLRQREDETWTWKVDLLKSEPYWERWFLGMNEIFLKLKAAKIVILAGIEKLDRDLTIAHMQGRFQLEALPKHGHLIQEDQAPALAAIFERWIERFGMLLSIAGPIRCTS